MWNELWNEGEMGNVKWAVNCEIRVKYGLWALVWERWGSERNESLRERGCEGFGLRDRERGSEHDLRDRERS